MVRVAPAKRLIATRERAAALIEDRSERADVLRGDCIDDRVRFAFDLLGCEALRIPVTMIGSNPDWGRQSRSNSTRLVLGQLLPIDGRARFTWLRLCRIRSLRLRLRRRCRDCTDCKYRDTTTQQPQISRGSGCEP